LLAKPRHATIPSMTSPLSTFGRPLTAQQKRQFFKDRYPVMVAPLLLLLGVSLGSSAPASTVLAWVAGAALVGLTINRLVR
jgi:hypothetical protein